jgi:hypothetical protein
VVNLHYNKYPPSIALRTNIMNYIVLKVQEDLDGRAVSALGVRSRKLNTGLNGQS